MNQVNNLTQWKNLSSDEKAVFDFEGYKYEVQNSFEGTDFQSFATGGSFPNGVYRLKIEPDRWYYMENASGFSKNTKGSDLNENAIEFLTILRPAKPDEIPKPKRVFKDGAFYPVIHKSDDQNDIVEYDKQKGHFITINWSECTIKAFSWIGEELIIKWGAE